MNKDQYEAIKKTRKSGNSQMEAIYQQNLEILEKIQDFEEMANVLVKLGNLSKKTRQLEKGISYFERALEMICKVLGFEHPKVAPILNNLGVIYMEMGFFAKSKSFFMQAIEIQKKNFGGKGQKTLTFQLNLATTLMKSGEIDESIQYYKESLDLVSTLNKDNDFESAKIIENMASAYKKYKTREKNEEALKLYQRSLAIFEKYKEIPQNYKQSYADLLANLTKTCIDMKKFNEAKILIEKSLGFHREQFGYQSKPMALCYNTNSMLYKKLGDLGLAVENQKKAVEIFEVLIVEGKKKGSFQQKIKNDVFLSSTSTEKKTKSENSSPTNYFIDKYEKENESFYEMNEMDLVGAVNSLGILHRESKNIKMAKECFQRAHDIGKGLKEKKNCLKMAEILNNLASAMIETGNEEGELRKAKGFLKEGIEIIKKISGKKKLSDVLQGNLGIVRKKIKQISK